MSKMAVARWFVVSDERRGEDVLVVRGFAAYREARSVYAATVLLAHQDGWPGVVQLLDADRRVLFSNDRVEEREEWAERVNFGPARFRYDPAAANVGGGEGNWVPA